jgi:hypothetical protein
MADSVIGSKEIAIFIITIVVQQVVSMTGAPFPLTPEQILAAGFTLMAAARILWTQGKITSFLPKRDKAEA